MENEVLFGNLCIQENLCTSDEIEDAIDTQKKLRKTGINKKLGEILIAKGIITVPQLENIIKIQYKLFQTDDEAVLGQLAVNNDIITRKQLESAQNILKNKFKEDSSKPHTLINVLVELGFADQSKINSLNKLYNQAFGRDRQLAFCAHCQLLVENIKGQCGSCGKKLPPLSKRGDTKIFRLMPETEESNRHDAITERLNAVSKSDESTVMTKVRASKRMEPREVKHIRELPEKFYSRRKIWYALGILVIGIVLGMFLRFNIDSKKVIPQPEKSTESEDTKIDTKNEKLSLDDLLPYRDLVETEKANILNALGFTPVSDGRWLPKSYVTEILSWQKKEGIDLSRLFPFEFDGKRIYAIVNKIDSNTYMLEFSDGSTKDYPAIKIIEQIQIYQEYQSLRKSKKVDESASKFLQRLGDFCDQNKWFVEARNNYILSFINDPENVEIRRKLKFILPGESGSDLESTIFQPELAEIPINPELPSVKLDVPLQKNLDVKYDPKMIDWKRIALPLSASDFIGGDAWNTDIERYKMNNGESLYLGYWVKSNFLKLWRNKGKSFRKTNLETDVLIACDDFQINNEILNTARILYQLSKNFFNRDSNEFLRKTKINTWLTFDKSVMIFVVSKGADISKYHWLKAKYDLIFVEIDDFRKLENLIFPLVRVFFRIYTMKGGLQAITPWIQNGLESEFAFSFLKKNSIIFEQNFLISQALETWCRLTSENIQNFHSTYKNNSLSKPNEIDNSCWGISRILLSSDLGDNLFIQSNTEEKATKSLLFVNEFKKIATELHSSLTYNCTTEQTRILNTVKLNPGNVDFLSTDFCEKIAKKRDGLFSSLNISDNKLKYSALELWTLIGLSVNFDLMKYGTMDEIQKLKTNLNKVFADKPEFLKLIQDY